MSIPDPVLQSGLRLIDGTVQRKLVNGVERDCLRIGERHDPQGYREEWIPIPDGMSADDFGRTFFRAFWVWPS